MNEQFNIHSKTFEEQMIENVCVEIVELDKGLYQMPFYIPLIIS